MAHINYITNCNLFLVENSGNEGYFYEPEYYTTIADARLKQSQWIAIGDTAKITVIEVTSRIFNEINEHWGGGIISLYDLVGVNGITPEEIGACLNPNSYTEELIDQKNELIDWLTNPERKNESAGALLARCYAK